MSEVYRSLIQAALLLAAILALTALGFAIARRFRGRAAQDKLDRHEMMAKFRELHDRGGLSDEEFRTIKAQLAAQLEREINENDDKG